jgi:selenophosphate synthase
MVKQYFLSIFVASIFCLATLPVQAGTKYRVSDVPEATDYNNDAATDMLKTSLTPEIIRIYPNPVYRGGLLTIDVPAGKGELTVSMYNTLGKITHTTKTADKKIEINMPDASGIYLLRFVEKQKVIAVEKIIVKE